MDAQIIPHVVTPLVAAFGIGLLLGIERELSHKPAGLRTQVLITVGTAVFVLSGKSLGVGVAGHISANIITGLGFLGAGVILQHGGTVRGLTTAALIWVNGALGVAVALERYALAATGLIAAILVLRWLGALERRIGRRCQITQYEVVARQSMDLLGAVQEAIRSAHFQEGPLSLDRQPGKTSVQFAFCASPTLHQQFVERLRNMDDVLTLKAR